MKRIVKRTGIIAAMMLLFSAATQQATAQNYGGYGDDDYVSYDDYSTGTYQDFYNDLAPYGQWINDPQYGYVWRPDVDNDFRPYYSRGHWAMTNYGNTWVSDYRWGWAAFHYGRWTYDSYYGWVWIPGNEWAPAWVSWRNGGGYYGWAPLGPGVNISVSLGNNWWGGDFWWTFIPQQYLFSNNFYNYYRGPRYNNTYIHNTTYIYNTNVSNHVTYYYGPRANEYQRATNQRVNVYNISNERKPGVTGIRGNTVSLYRPAIRNNGNVNGRRPAPVNAISAPRAIGRSNAVSINPQTALPSTKPAFNPRDYRNAQQQQPARNNNNMQQTRDNNNNMQQVRQPRNVSPVQNMDNRPGTQPQRNNQQMEQQRIQQQQQMQQQRDQQMQQQRMDQQRVQQQRDQQMQQQRIQQQQMQQQRDQQMQQQRMDQQRVQQQQRDQQMQQQQMQQQRDQQMQQQRMEQQRVQQQQRDQQMQQQRIQQQQMQQQRDQQMQQQRMQQQQQREQQMQQQRMQQQQMQQQQREQRPAPQERSMDHRR